MKIKIEKPQERHSYKASHIDITVWNELSAREMSEVRKATEQFINGYLDKYKNKEVNKIIVKGGWNE